jgi:RNA polymerase sigma-70 factor (ECF subfamily)
MKQAELHPEQLHYYWAGVLVNDNEAFKKIHSVLFNGLYNYALKFLNDEALAEDAVQELFVKIWVKRSSIGSITHVKSYFFTTLRRQMLNQLRNLKLKQLKIRTYNYPDIEFSREEIIIKEEHDAWLHQKIHELLNQLPARQREVVYLRYFENMSTTEITTVMKINYQSVQNLLQKAFEKLRASDMLKLFVLVALLGLQRK